MCGRARVWATGSDSRGLPPPHVCTCALRGRQGDGGRWGGGRGQANVPPLAIQNPEADLQLLQSL
eukprot:365446-Chlamydomonas_euryale.AAC.3